MTRKTEQHAPLMSREDAASLVLFLATLAGLLAATGIASGVDKQIVWVLSALGSAGGAYAFELQKKVTKQAKSEPSQSQRQQIDRKQEQVDDLQAQLNAANAMIATLRKEYHSGDTLSAYAAERAQATGETQ